MTRSRNVVTAVIAFLAVGVIISGTEAKPPSRIVGGQLAKDNEFTATVTLTGLGNGFLHGCGGGIIGPRFILTAAHCFSKSKTADIRVRAGIHNTKDRDNAIERSVSKVIIHPDYSEVGTMDTNDIAVMVLKDALPIGGRVSQLQLPTHKPEEGFYFLAGWGKNSPRPTTPQFDLKTLTLKLAPCHGMTGTFCASSEQGSSCSGDSGSPLMTGGTVYGVVSAGYCTVGAPTTFVDVYHYIDWIKNIMTTN